MEALEATPMETPLLAKGDVVLMCGCTVHFDVALPHKKETLWCVRHKIETKPASIGTGKSFRVSCETCKYTRGKTGKLDADTSAVRHREKHPHHTVNVHDVAGTIVHTFKDSEAVTTLPDLPPY